MILTGLTEDPLSRLPVVYASGRGPGCENHFFSKEEQTGVAILYRFPPAAFWALKRFIGDVAKGKEKPWGPGSVAPGPACPQLLTLPCSSSASSCSSSGLAISSGGCSVLPQETNVGGLCSSLFLPSHSITRSR